METSETSNWISLVGVIADCIGVIVTGFFSYWIMRITKETAIATKESANAAKESANAAKAGYELSMSITTLQEKKENQLRAAMRETYLKLLLDRSMIVNNALLAQNKNMPNVVSLDHKAMNDAPKTSGLTDEQLAEFFTKEERELVYYAWKSFDDYLKNHWPGDKYSGDQILSAAVNTANSITHFYNLIETLKRAR